MALWGMTTNQNDCRLKRTIGCVLEPPGVNRGDETGGNENMAENAQ